MPRQGNSFSLEIMAVVFSCEACLSSAKVYHPHAAAKGQNVVKFKSYEIVIDDWQKHAAAGILHNTGRHHWTIDHSYLHLIMCQKRVNI